MNRRHLLAQIGAIAILPMVSPDSARSALSVDSSAGAKIRRVRPSDPNWPTVSSWEKLNRDVGGRLIKVQPLLAGCAQGISGAGCQDLLRALRNPYYVGDQPAGTQTVGWVDAWMSTPSVYAVAAESTSDVVSAVNFARDNRLRLVIKGGGHSYQGTSDAPNSLLIWTRGMDGITLHDNFVARGCAGAQQPLPAVTLAAGVVWVHAYNAVTTKAGRYVQGGGCATVGVAGLIQSGGFGSFSKNYGTAAAGLLEAEIVTADGQARIANVCTNPDLFWGIKGGGGGSLGVVTRLTLRTRELPVFFGGVDLKVRAASDAAFLRLIRRFVNFCAERLINPHWGESVTLGADNTFTVGMVFQGFNRQQVQDVWQPFVEWIASSPADFTVLTALNAGVMPAREWWNPDFNEQHVPGRMFPDRRSGAPADNVWFAEQNIELGIYIHGYQSLWLPAALLQSEWQGRLADALFAATRHWAVMLHFNKGLAGADAAEVAAARDTAMNPAVLAAFALAIIAGGDPAAYPDLLGHPPDLTKARANAVSIRKAADALRRLVPSAGSYLSESNFFEQDWQHSFWGPNYPRLRAVKAKYDPEGLFFVHHGVGSEDWSADGFTRLK